MNRSENGPSGAGRSQTETSVIEISKKARQKFRARRYDEARELFQTGLEREPDNPYLLSGMGDACRESGDYPEAERCYRRLLEVDRKNLFALRGLGDVCKKLQRHQEAIRLWTQYLTLRPRDKHVMTRIADSSKALMQFDKAEEVYRQIIQADPQDRFALTGMADLQHRMGNDEVAIRYYEKVLTFDENELHILTIIGKLCWRISDFEKAENFFRRALKVDPHNPYALYGLGNCYRWHRKYAKAIEIWSEILKFSSGTQALHSRMGDAWVNLGDLDKAEICYRKSLEQGYDRYAEIGLVRLYCDREDFTLAGAAFASLMDNEENPVLQLEELSRRFVRSGRRDVMLRYFRYLLEETSLSQNVRRELKTLLEKLDGDS